MEIRGKVEECFGQAAIFISRNPWKIIFLVVILQTMFALCLLSLKLDNSIAKMYTSKRSQTDRNIAELLPRYPDMSGSDFDPNRSVKKPLYADVIFHSQDEQQEGIKQEDIREALGFIRSISVDTGYSKMADLTSFCALKHDKCVIAGTKILFLNDEFAVEHLDEFYSKRLLSDHRVKVRFYLRHETRRRQEESKRWLQTFVRVMSEHKKISNLTHVFSHSESFLEEIDNDTYPDIPNVSFIFTVFITYYGFLVSGGDCLTKRVHIGRMAVFVVGLGIMGSWGFLSGCGKSFTNITGIMPYFALYFGVDLALELLSSVSNNIREENAVQRVSKAVREKCVTCTIVLLAHVIPFSTVIYSSYKAVTTFALFTVVTLVFIFLTHFTFFVACLAIHERRIDENRHCCTCLILYNTDDPEVQDRSSCFRCCCTGRKPSTKKQLEGTFERLARKSFSKTVLVTPIKLFFILLLFGYLGTAVWKTCSTKLDVFPEDSIASASYYSDFYDVNSQYFRSQPPLMFIVSGPVDLNNQSTMKYYLKLFQETKGLSFMNEMSSFWLFDLYTYGNFTQMRTGNLTTDIVKEFIANTSKYTHDIEWGLDNSTILSFRFYVYANPISSSSSAISVKRKVDKFVKRVQEDCQLSVHIPSLWLYDSYRSPLYETIRFVCSQVAVVVVLSIVTGNHVLSVLHVIAWHVSFGVGLLGSMAIFDVSINSLSIIIMMLGFSYNIEVIIYTLNSYSHSEGLNPAARTYNVLQSTTPIVFNTTFGMFCGLMVLFVQKSYVFITTLKILATSTLLACVHATIFIPAALSIVGAGGAMYIKQRNEAEHIEVWSINGAGHIGNTLANGEAVDRRPSYANPGFVDDKTYF